MGMYVCGECVDARGLDARQAGFGGTGHAACELCAWLAGDWEVKPVLWTDEITRMPELTPEKLRAALAGREPEDANKLMRILLG